MMYTITEINALNTLATAYVKMGMLSEDSLREILKKILLISINADNRARANKAIIKEYPDIKHKLTPYGLTLSSLIDKFEQTHKPITNYFFSGQGIYLQNTDSKIMNDLLVNFTKLGKPALPVHDSVIVQEKDKLLLKDIMKQSYTNNIKGFTCEIKEVNKSS